MTSSSFQVRERPRSGAYFLKTVQAVQRPFNCCDVVSFAHDYKRRSYNCISKCIVDCSLTDICHRPAFRFGQLPCPNHKTQVVCILNLRHFDTHLPLLFLNVKKVQIIVSFESVDMQVVGAIAVIPKHS